MDNLERKTDIVMVDDGMGDRIVIPSIFIHYKYGDLLKNYILTNKSL